MWKIIHVKTHKTQYLIFRCERCEVSDGLRGCKGLCERVSVSYSFNSHCALFDELGDH